MECGSFTENSIAKQLASAVLTRKVTNVKWIRGDEGAKMYFVCASYDATTFTSMRVYHITVHVILFIGTIFLLLLARFFVVTAFFPR